MIVALAMAKGADLETSVTRAGWFAVAVTLLSIATYGVAETLAYHVGRQGSFGPLIPAIGVTPFMLCGGIYPLSTLPTALRWLSYVLPWTHAAALVRYGLVGAHSAGLGEIWGFGSPPLQAAASALCLLVFAAAFWATALRVFRNATVA